ncbi:unnamed protein product [Effrenium voratum]|uniref:Carrier domain-containing protein n=1 Tax=Effrenium voratum TaxID=2562239 RepID=A0AA36IYX8_9DINO|nr:unnamed protein product [Effrenium voratum]
MPSRDSFRDARAMEIEKRRVADLVAAALPQGEVPEEEEEVPLRELGLDSVSATFLQGQLSELFGRPFGDLGATTLAQLAALLRSEAEAPKAGWRSWGLRPGLLRRSLPSPGSAGSGLPGASFASRPRWATLRWRCCSTRSTGCWRAPS